MKTSKIIYPKKACACAVSLDLLGDKWTLIIIRDIFKGKNKFSQFLKESREGISSNSLVDRLKKLVLLGIIDFSRNINDKKIKEYYLTDKGIDLFPIIHELKRWSVKHVEFEFTENTKEFASSITKLTSDEIIEKQISKYRQERLSKFEI